MAFDILHSKQIEQYCKTATFPNKASDHGKFSSKVTISKQL